MKAGMIPVAILLVPVIGSLVIGSIYGSSVQAVLNPGNTIMASSDHTFQSDTFSLDGSVGSTLVDNTSDSPDIVTGRWSLDVENGNVTGFLAEIAIINANGTGYRALQLSNLSSATVTMSPNGTAVVSGTLDVSVNDTKKFNGVDATISIAKLRALSMIIDSQDATKIFKGQPLYGIADQTQQTVTASNLTAQKNGSGLLGNISDHFKLPQLPNPFR